MLKEPQIESAQIAGRACANNTIVAIALYGELKTVEERAAFLRGIAEGQGIAQ